MTIVGLLMVIDKQNNKHTTPPQTPIEFIIPRPKGIVSCHKSGTGDNQGRQWTTPHDNRYFNRIGSQSKSNKFSLPMISVSPPLNNSVINPYQLSSVYQQSSSSSHFNPQDNRCFNSKDSNSNINEFPLPVIPVPTPLNDSVINPYQLSSVCKQSPISSHNTTH